MIKGFVPVEPDGIAVRSRDSAPDLPFGFSECKCRPPLRLVQLCFPPGRKRPLPLDGHILFQKRRLQLLTMPDSWCGHRREIKALSIIIKIDRINETLSLFFFA